MAAAMLAAVASVSAQEKVYITEFMAANVRTLADRNRDYPDWIELHNAGAGTVNLDGWFLTDDRDDLKKWRFPAVPLAANEYLVVFASGKDRHISIGDLHTNFKLDATRGYLALVKPDGRSIASDFGTQYPEQVAHCSYGLEMGDRTVALLPADAPKRAFVPTTDIGLNWAAPDFDDRSWVPASNGVSFSNDAGSVAADGTKLRERMIGNATSAYLRAPFTVEDPGFESLKLRLRYNDGFIAYLNGWEVARRNAPAKAKWNSVATAAHGQGTATMQEERFDSAEGPYTVSQFNSLTRPRAVLNLRTEASGYLRLVNGQQTNQINSITFPAPSMAVPDSVNVEFDFRWKANGDGTERLAVLLLPASQFAASQEGIDLNSLRGAKDPKFPGVLAVQLLHNVENGQKALTVHWDRVKRTTVDLPSSAFGQRVFHHARLQLRHSPQGAALTVTLISNPNGPQTLTFTPVSNLLIPGMRPYSPRLQFSGRIGHWDQTIDLENVVMELGGAGSRSAEEFDISSHLNVLRAGRNVLAIHGLNQSPDDPTFALQPELVAGFGAVRSNEVRYFAVPTPRAANRPGFRALSPPPVFSLRSGVFKEPIRVELTARAGVVRYTLDGSEPGANSQIYSEPISLTGSALLKARTFAPDQLPSGTVAETFTLLDESAAGFNSNLPLIILNPFGQYLSSNNRSTISLRVIDTVQGRSTLLGAADFDGRASVNVRGFSTLRQPKNSLTVRFIDENQDKYKTSVLGLPKESDWVLYAPYSDKTLIRDALAYELSNQMGRYAPRTRFVEVFIDRTGGKLSQRDYMGVYVLVEKIKRGKNRVNIAELSPSDTSEPAITGGYIFKRDHSDRYEPSFRTGRTHYYYVEPNAKDMSRDQINWISTYMNRFEQALYGSNFRDPDRGYAAYLDVDAFIDQHWLIEMSKNIDGFRYSAYLHKDRGGKLQTGPAWDWNLSFGNADYYDASDPSGWYTPMLRESEISWFRRLDDDPDFSQKTVDRWGELRRGVFDPTRILARVDEMAAQLDDAQARNFRRWPILGRRVNPNDFVGRTYEEEIRWMKQWIQKRIAWIDNQFIHPPSLTEAKGSINLSAGTGRIYYTLDGTDPRLPGGGVSPKAKTFSSPIPASDASKLFARVQHRSRWSPPTLARDRPAQRTARSNR
jgi:hypothetical protein